MNDSQSGPVSSLEEGPIPKTGNLHLKSGNVPKNQVHDFKLSLSQKWKELPPEEKANYVHPDKEGYSSASYSEGSTPAVYKVDTRTSPHRFKSLIGEFNEEKLAACRELGFGPLLKLAITKMHLSILRLIVDATSASDKSITMHGTKLPLSANDVENVMGLKNGGSPVVFEGHVKDYTELEATANEMAGPDHKIQLAKVEAYLKETQLVDDKFKRLFILFTMSTIISPTASLSIPKKWLLCARNPADCALKNWAEYVFDSLMAGISEFQQRENGAKTSGKFCNGCLLFLELFHFDCVGHEKHFVDRTLYPIEAWGDKEVGRVLKYINQLGGMLDSRVGWKKVGGRVRTDDVAPGVSRQEFDLAMGRVGRLEDQVRNIGAEMGQGFAAIISRLDSMGAAGPSKAKGRGKKKEVPVDLDRSPPKKKVTVILSDSTSIVSPEKKDIPKPNPFEGKNRRINIGSFRVYGDGDVIDKGVVTNVCDPCSAQELVEKIVLSTSGDIWATRKHIKTLQPNQWVVDDVINMFSNYLNQEQNERDKTPRSHFLDTCFAQKIQSHLEGLQVLDFAAGDMEFKFKKGLFAQFELYDPPHRPIQVNGDDCGIYVIMHMKHFGLVWWTGYDSHTIRMKLMIELVRNKYNQLWPTIESKVKKQLSSPPKKGSVKNPARRLSMKRRPSDVRRSG
ncbi:hypothetical protein ACLB2K_073544 [Fragaria x ananassa]